MAIVSMAFAAFSSNGLPEGSASTEYPTGRLCLVERETCHAIGRQRERTYEALSSKACKDT